MGQDPGQRWQPGRVGPQVGQVLEQEVAEVAGPVAGVQPGAVEAARVLGERDLVGVGGDRVERVAVPAPLRGAHQPALAVVHGAADPALRADLGAQRSVRERRHHRLVDRHELDGVAGRLVLGPRQ